MDIRFWSELKMVSAGTPPASEFEQAFRMDEVINDFNEQPQDVCAAFAMQDDTVEYLTKRGYCLIPSRHFSNVWLLKDYPFGSSWDVGIVTDVSIKRDYSDKDITRAKYFVKNSKEMITENCKNVIESIRQKEYEIAKHHIRFQLIDTIVGCCETAKYLIRHSLLEDEYMPAEDLMYAVKNFSIPAYRLLHEKDETYYKIAEELLKKMLTKKIG